jgi:hypothetical protein
MGLIDGVPPSNANGLYNICGPLGLLHHNGSNSSESTSGSNPVGFRAYFQHWRQRRWSSLTRADGMFGSELWISYGFSSSTRADGMFGSELWISYRFSWL